MKPNFLDASRYKAEFTRSDLFPKILLVDDEPEILLATDQLLVRAGFAVTAVNSAEEAVVKLQIEPFDFVVTDFRLVGKQGDAVVIAARNTCPATPVVLVTGLVDDLPEWMVSGDSALPIVPKPFRVSELLIAMKRAMAETSVSLAVPG
jgi:two-component system C4-dicarboxylate transport response regulator DctD